MSVFVGISVSALATNNFNGSVFKTDKECVLWAAETFHIVKLHTFPLLQFDAVKCVLHTPKIK